MGFQTVFKRYEIKYRLTYEQRDELLLKMQEHMTPDSFGRSTIRNIYYDTDSYRLIRSSVEKPVYKEKLRVRSYCKASADSTVFVELKKKYKGVVYKRRLALPCNDAEDWLARGRLPDVSSQITDEIEYFRRYYETLRPAVFLSYERQAFYSPEDENFRITFDQNILARTTELSLCEDVGGFSLLPPPYVLMEIKTAGGIPLWMTSFLSENKIYKTSFSKYGTAYTEYIYGKGANRTCLLNG